MITFTSLSPSLPVDAEWQKITDKEMDSFIIVVIDIEHQFQLGVFVHSVVQDSEGNAITFPSKDSAQSWIDLNKSIGCAYAIICVSELEFQF